MPHLPVRSFYIPVDVETQIDLVDVILVGGDGDRETLWFSGEGAAIASVMSSLVLLPSSALSQTITVDPARCLTY